MPDQLVEKNKFSIDKDNISAFQAQMAQQGRWTWILAHFVTILSLFGTYLDEIFFTPLRDLQVFTQVFTKTKNFFSKYFGPSHPSMSIGALIFSALAATPLVLRAIFKKKQVNTLHETLENLKKEMPRGQDRLDNIDALTTEAITYLKTQPNYKFENINDKTTHPQGSSIPELKRRLKLIFDMQLLKQGSINVRACIKEDPKNPDKLDLEFDFLDPGSRILGKDWHVFKNAKLSDLHWLLNPDGINPNSDRAFDIKVAAVKEAVGEIKKAPAKERMHALKELSKLFAKTNYTLEECLNEHTQSLDFYKLSTGRKILFILSWMFSIGNETSFGYWLFFFVQDMRKNQDYSAVWSRHLQFDVLIGAAAFATIKVGSIFSGYLLTLFGLRKPQNTNIVRKAFIEQAHDTSELKHRLLTNLVLDQLRIKQLKLAQQTPLKEPEKDKIEKHIRKLVLKISIHENIEAIIKAKSSKEVEAIALPGKYKQNNYVQHYYLHLKEEADPASIGFKRLFSFADKMLSNGILISFLGWVVGAACVAAASSGVVLTIGTALLTSPFLSVAIFAGGMLFGVACAIWQVYNTRKNENALNEQIKANFDKFKQLNTLQAQNEKLKAFLRDDKRLEPLTIAEPDDEEFFNFLTTKSNTAATVLGQITDASCVAIGRAGSAVLAVRLEVIPFMTGIKLAKILGVSLSTIFLPPLAALSAVGFITGPIGLGIAIPLALGWIGFNLYFQYKKIQLDKATKFIGSIDERIKLAKDNQHIYLRQLGYNKDELHVPVAPPVLPVAVSNDSNLAAANAEVEVIGIFAARASEPIKIALGEQSAHINSMGSIGMFSSANSRPNSSPPKSVASTPSPERGSPDLASDVVDGVNNVDEQTDLQMNRRAAGGK